jgi:site-specific recombinase XerD
VSQEQLPLFPDMPEPQADGGEAPQLCARSSLQSAVRAFRGHMERVDFSEYTIQSFLGDLRLLERYLGAETEIGAIASKDLRGFMDYLQHGRGVSCTPKSYARRLTTLKVFFAWLAGANVVPGDPAAPLVHKPAASPLPAILYDEQVERAQEACRALLADEKKPDPRPQFLFNLLLQTGMKKGECLALQPGHFDLSDPAVPAVYIRYKDPRRQHKERRLALEPGLPAMLRRYLAAYTPRDALFPCTGRNLEYVLHRIARVADLEGGISFEMLRWTSAVRDYRRGMEPEALRRKLGLSQMAWEDTLAKLQALTANAGP